MDNDPYYFKEHIPQPEVLSFRQREQPSTRSTGVNRFRGLVFAFLVIPFAALAWALLSSIPVVPGLIPIATAVGAALMYKLGSGDASLFGAVVISFVTVVSTVLGFLSGMWLDMVNYFHRNPWTSLTDEATWDQFFFNLGSNNPQVWDPYVPLQFMALVAIIVGCMIAIRTMLYGSNR